MASGKTTARSATPAAWQAEKRLRGLQSLPAWQAEEALRGLQPLPAWQGKVRLSGCARTGQPAPPEVKPEPEVKQEPEVKLEPEVKQEPFTIRGYFGIL